MSKRRYFDCPIQALYMMREFGVVIVFEEDGRVHNIRDLNIDQRQNLLVEVLEDIDLIVDKFYVCKESEAIFEPKEGDLGQNPFSKEIMIFTNNRWRMYLHRFAEKCVEGKKESGNLIFMRNGKNFFQGEVEND